MTLQNDMLVTQLAHGMCRIWADNIIWADGIDEFHRNILDDMCSVSFSVVNQNTYIIKYIYVLFDCVK